MLFGAPPAAYSTSAVNRQANQLLGGSPAARGGTGISPANTLGAQNAINPTTLGTNQQMAPTSDQIIQALMAHGVS